MSLSDEEEKLLIPSSNLYPESENECASTAPQVSRSSRLNLHVYLLYVFLSFATILNISQYMYTLRTASHLDTGRSRYSGIGFTHEQAYHSPSEYTPKDPATADKLWASLVTDQADIALSQEEVRRYGLPEESAVFPWDRSRRLYVVKVFHHIHCLKSIRESVVRSERGLSQLVPWGHVHHCLDSIRQDITCAGDDTPMKIDPETGTLGHGQVSHCRDLDAIARWVSEPEHNPCYKSLSDYKQENHTLERFAFCPDDSPYKETMEAYFDKWGHKQAFLENGEDSVAFQDQ